MTLEQYIANPMGVKNAVFSHREMYRSLYIQKLDKLLVKENNKINYTLYKDKNRYLIHFKIPSEVVDKFYYDVVFEFVSNGKDKNIRNMDCNFYSNDPSFVYTFAHAFLKNRMFIKDLIPRMSKEAIKKLAVEKNPTNQVGYVKSIYFAYLISSRFNLLDISVFNHAERYNKKKLLSEIMHADEKIKLRKEEGEKLSVSKRKEKEHNKTMRSKDINNIDISNSVSTTNSVRNINTVSTIGKSKVSKRVKKI